jgi:hypothetical protein
MRPPVEALGDVGDGEPGFAPLGGDQSAQLLARALIFRHVGPRLRWFSVT